MKNKLFLYAYCCDFEPYRGEGILANNFIGFLSKIYKNLNIVVVTPGNKFVYTKIKKNIYSKKKLNHSFFFKYLSPILGIIKIWIYHLGGHKTTYVNFLPLWNIFLFMLLPRKTILGPITGGHYQGKELNITTMLRKIIIFKLYSISVFFIKIRKLKCIFSTKLLLGFLSNDIKNKSRFNFQFYNYSFQKKEKKKIDIIYYNRNYHTKDNKLVVNILKNLNKNYNIIIVGNYIEGFKNLGIVKRDKIINLLKKTRFVFSSPENQLSYFVLDAISCDARIISTSKLRPSFFNDYFIFPKKIDYANIKKILAIKNSKSLSLNYISGLKKNNLKLLNFMKSANGY